MGQWIASSLGGVTTVEDSSRRLVASAIAPLRAEPELQSDGANSPSNEQKVDKTQLGLLTAAIN